MELTKEKMLEAFLKLNEALVEENIRGEITLFGGAVMCLVFDARPSTKDVDVVFSPKQYEDILRDLSYKIAPDLGLEIGWLNDAVKIFILNSKSSSRIEYLKLSNLIIYSASPEFMFALKAKSGRISEFSSDLEDIKFLISYLNISSLDDALFILNKYFEPDVIKPGILDFISNCIKGNLA